MRGRKFRALRGLTYLCGQRPRPYSSQGEEPPAPHSLLFPTAHSAAGAPNRGISAEMQCGTASRAARDLTGEPCSPVNPFFLDGGFWLGEGASCELSGVSGRISASGRTTSCLTPTIFLWYRQAAPSLFLKKRWWGRPSPAWKAGSLVCGLWPYSSSPPKGGYLAPLARLNSAQSALAALRRRKYGMRPPRRKKAPFRALRRHSRPVIPPPPPRRGRSPAPLPGGKSPGASLAAAPGGGAC